MVDTVKTAGKQAGGSYEPTEKDRKTVLSLASHGTKQCEIAAVLGIDPKTLRKHFRDELDTARTRANGRVADCLYLRATDMRSAKQGGDPRGQVTAAIWWTKAQMGWSERSRTEITGADGGPVQVQRTPMVFLPAKLTDSKPDGESSPDSTDGVARD